MESDHMRTQVPFDFILTLQLLLCVDPWNSERIRHMKQSLGRTGCRESLCRLDSVAFAQLMKCLREQTSPRPAPVVSGTIISGQCSKVLATSI